MTAISSTSYWDTVSGKCYVAVKDIKNTNPLSDRGYRQAPVFRLAIQANSKLHDSLIAGERRDRRGAAAADVCAGLPEECVVCHIEDVPARFRIPVLVNGNAFDQSSIAHLRVRTAQGVASAVNDNILARIGEGICQTASQSGARAVGTCVEPARLLVKGVRLTPDIRHGARKAVGIEQAALATPVRLELPPVRLEGCPL